MTTILNIPKFLKRNKTKARNKAAIALMEGQNKPQVIPAKKGKGSYKRKGKHRAE